MKNSLLALRTCFNDNHEPAIVLQEAVVELDSVYEIIHKVDHLFKRELWGTFNLTLQIEACIHTSLQFEASLNNCSSVSNTYVRRISECDD